MQLSQAEQQIIELYRSLDPHQRMEITKQKGEQECRIDVHKVVFIMK